MPADVGGAGGMRRGREILFEGYTEDEILALPREQVETMILTGETIVFRAGSATVLGEFRVEGNRLRIELAQIEGGGEGVLLGLGALARRFAWQCRRMDRPRCPLRQAKSEAPASARRPRFRNLETADHRRRVLQVGGALRRLIDRATLVGKFWTSRFASDQGLCR